MKHKITIIILAALAACNFEDPPSNPPPVSSGPTSITGMPGTGDESGASGSTGMCEDVIVQYECSGFVAGVYQHTNGNRAMIISGIEYYNCLNFGTPGINTCSLDLGQGIDYENPENGTELGAIETILDACRAECQAKVDAGDPGYTFPASGGSGWTLQDEVCVFEHEPDGCAEPEVCGAHESTGGCGFVDGTFSPAQVRVNGLCPEGDGGENCEEVSCTGWNPVSQTQRNASSSVPKVSIDDDFFATLLANPMRLVACDVGRYVQHDSTAAPPPTWWDFSALVAGDFFWEIGLRTGDRDVSVKIGSTYWPLNTSDQIGDAIHALGASTTFKIKYKRGGSFQPEISVKLLECGSSCSTPTW